MTKTVGARRTDLHAPTERGVDLSDRRVVEDAIHELNTEQLAHRLLP
jgi:hypothetical protein